MTARPLSSELEPGTSIRWEFPNGVTGEAKIGSVMDYDDEGFSFFDRKQKIIGYDGNVYYTFLRHLRIEWLTHYRNRRLRSPKPSRQNSKETVELTSVPKQFRFLD